MSRRTVRLGCSMSLSGEEATHGRHMAAAAKLAVQEAQVSGDGPWNLELTVLDDAGDAGQAVAAARELVADPTVLGVVGPCTSDTAAAAAPIYFGGRLAHISPAASNPDLSRGGYDTFFRTVCSDEVQGSEAARLAVRYLHCRIIAIVHDGTAFGRALAETFSRAALDCGATIAMSERVAIGQREFGSTIARLRDAAPDLIYCGLIEAEGAAFAAELRRCGVLSPLFGTDALKPSRFLETPGFPVAGPYYTSAATDVTRAPSAHAFRHAFGNFSIYTAEAYDAARILISACCSSRAENRESVREAVARTVGFPGASGSISFDQYGDLVDPRLDFYAVERGHLRYVGEARSLGRS